MIYRKYETEKDKETEIRLGKYFVEYYMPDVQVLNLGFLSPFDFSIKKDGELYGFLEVKKKTGDFSKYEIIPENKWSFMEKTEYPCYMLIERDTRGRVFNMSEIMRSKLWYHREIARRADQPEGSKKVVFFFSDKGKDIYYF